MTEENKDQEQKLTPEELEELEFHRKSKAKRKAKAKRRLDKDEVSVTITSLMDIMTILLVFMLKNYSTDPLNVTQTDDLQLVPSVHTEKTKKDLTPLAVTSTHILVDDNPVVQVKDGKVSASAKRDGEDGYFISPLFDSLQAVVEHQRKIAQYNPSVKFEGRVLIVGDKNVPYRLLSEVMYTAGQAEFGEFEFAVIAN